MSAVWDCARRAYVSDSASWRADLSGMGAGLLGNRLPVFGVGRTQLLGLEGVRPGSFFSSSRASGSDSAGGEVYLQQLFL